ncbi:MAG: thiopurine S-methyltransferase [Acidiferrobacterales bacterium]
MDHDFWRDKWQNKSIGFHQTEVNHYLQKYIDELALASADTVFVPLCGKSLDMWWLHKQGFNVIGIEISEIAASSFFTEAGKQACNIKHGDFVSWKYADVEILCGDFFDLNADVLGKVDAVFDRAALIALPLEMRAKYIDQLGHLLLSGTRGLLVTLEYPQDEMTGPPFSVTEQEVDKLYARNFQLDLIEDHNAFEENSRFRERGLTVLREKIYRFHKR